MKFRFFINEEKGTVAVKAIDPLEEYYREFLQFYHKYKMDPDYTLFEAFIGAYSDQINKIVGVASCNREEGDEFNLDFGKELARQRYMKTFESFRINMYAMILGKLDATIGAVVKRLNFSCTRRAERENIIADMTARAE